MKKLERLDGKLFENLKQNEILNLTLFLGGTDLRRTNAYNPDGSLCGRDTVDLDTSSAPGADVVWDECSPVPGNEYDIWDEHTTELFIDNYIYNP